MQFNGLLTPTLSRKWMERTWVPGEGLNEGTRIKTPPEVSFLLPNLLPCRFDLVLQKQTNEKDQVFYAA